MSLCEYVLICLVLATVISAQVCSPLGGLCTRTTDCCKGCCEAHSCVDRSFACSTDLVQQAGFSSCVSYYCPPGYICYLREVCPPENPCPPQPSCRRVDAQNNNSDWYYRNSFPRTSAGHLFCYVSLSTLILSIVSYMFM